MRKPVIANRKRRGFILITHTLMSAFTLAGMRAKAMVVDRVCWGSEA